MKKEFEVYFSLTKDGKLNSWLPKPIKDESTYDDFYQDKFYPGTVTLEIPEEKIVFTRADVVRAVSVASHWFPDQFKVEILERAMKAAEGSS